MPIPSIDDTICQDVNGYDDDDDDYDDGDDGDDDVDD